MLRTALLFVSLFLLVIREAQSEPPKAAEGSDPAAAAALETDREKASYYIGWSVGNQLHEKRMDVDADLLVKALRAGLKGDGKPADINGLQQATMKFELAAQQQFAERNLKEGEAFLAKNKKRLDVAVLPSGLQYQVLEEGSGERPQPSDRVKVHYHGTLIDGTVFDSSIDREKPMIHAANGFIHGWNEALGMMRAGAKWRLFVPADLAYGPQQRGSIGPNSTLIFEVELLGIE